MKQGVYEIANTLNGKAYGGSSSNIRKRWQEHRRTLDKGEHRCTRLQRAWDKYGEDVFEFTVLERIEDTDLRLAAEQEWLDAHFAQGTCYNTAVTAGPAGPMAEETKQKISEGKMGKRNPMWGKPPSEEHRRKLSEAGRGNQNAKGYKHTEEAKRKISKANSGKLNPNWGKRPSNETRRKLSEALMGRKLTEEHKRNMSKAMLGKQNALGCKHTDETKRKQSVAHMGNQSALGHKHTDEARRKMSMAQMGHTHTEETRCKIGDARRGKKHTEEALHKMSEARKLWWAKKKEAERQTNAVLYYV